MPAVTTTPNVLVLLPARARQVIYVLFGLVGLANGSALVAYASAGYALPAWLIVSTAVIAYLAVPFGALASLNVATERQPADDLPDVPHAEHLLSPTEQAKRQAAKDELEDLRQQTLLARRDPTDVASRVNWDTTDYLAGVDDQGNPAADDAEGRDE